MRHALIIPTYGFITDDESRSGGQGTIARIRVAQDLINEGKIARTLFTFFPQRMLPEGYERFLIGNVPLGENVASYVEALIEFRLARVESKAVSVGTFEDTIVSLERIHEVEGDNPVQVHFVSDWSQLGRLWIIWHLAFKKPLMWSAKFHLVPNFRTRQDVWFHEPPAYLKCLMLSLLKRLKD